MVTPPKQPVTGPHQHPHQHQHQQQEPPPSPLSERFPQLKRVRLEVDFHDSGGTRVQRRCRELLAEAPANFEMKCPLDAAILDLRPLVSRMVSERARHRSGQVKCTGSRSGSEHSASYVIELQYLTKGR